jgi:hypothetical protein
LTGIDERLKKAGKFTEQNYTAVQRAGPATGGKPPLIQNYGKF